jgi:hypothetical protein
MPYRDITLNPSRDANGEIVWKMDLSHGGGSGGPTKFPKLVLNSSLKDVEIGVKIMHANQMGVKFSDDPIWIEKLSACPGKDDPPPPSPQSATIYSDQIKDITKYNDQQITFVDLNKGDPMCLNYRLNFIDTQKSKDIHLDPIVDNGGGGYAPPPTEPGGWGIIGPGSSAFYILLAAIFLASFAGIVVARLLKIGRG